MRIVSWNINGLRAVLKRGFGDIASLLDFLEAGECENVQSGSSLA